MVESVPSASQLAEMPSTLSEDGAPSTSLNPLEGSGCSNTPEAQPQQLGSLPWPQELASAGAQDEDSPLSSIRRRPGLRVSETS